MRKMRLSRWMFCVVMVCVGTTCVYSQQATVTQLEARLKQDLSSGDANRIARNFSELYSDAGQPRQEAMAKLSAAGKEISSVQITELKQFPGAQIASARIVIAGSGQTVTGFANLIREDGQWKIFGINAFAETQLREGNQMFACPTTPEGFSFEAERGDWPAWPAAKIYSVSYRPTQGPDFDKAAWEKRVITAWNQASPNLIGDYLSSKYVHLGFSKGEVLRGVTEIFRKYNRINMRYRVIDFKYLNDKRNLVSYKAVMELSGVPKGATQSIKILETLGYGSVIYENGNWRQYSSQFFK